MILCTDCIRSSLPTRFLGKTPIWRFGLMWWPVYARVVRHHRRSSIAKWGNRIYRERFYRESPNVTQTSTPVGSTTTLYMTSLGTCGWQLAKFQKGSKNATTGGFGWNSRERFKRGSRNFAGVSWTIGPTKWPDITSLSVSCQLQNAIKSCMKVRKKDATSIEAHDSVTVWCEITSNDRLNLTVSRDCKDGWVDGRKRFWSQLNDSKTVTDRPYYVSVWS